VLALVDEVEEAVHLDFERHIVLVDLGRVRVGGLVADLGRVRVMRHSRSHFEFFEVSKIL